jgi:hypothetical protein
LFLFSEGWSAFTAQLWRALTPLAPQHAPAANSSAIFRDSSRKDEHLLSFSNRKSLYHPASTNGRK